VKATVKALGTAWLIGLLSALLPLHGMAAGVLMTLGPAHTHEAEPLGVKSGQSQDAHEHEHEHGDEQHDDEHAPGAAQQDPWNEQPREPHQHAENAAERHHHPADDTSVVGVDRLDQEDSALNISPGLVCLVALPTGPSSNALVALRNVCIAHSAWPSLTQHPSPPEQPPRLD
jgi:hypothetical protein